MSFEADASGVEQVAFSLDGQYIATTSVDPIIRLWSPRNGASLGSLEGHGGYISSIAFSVDGKLLASASGDTTVMLWNTQTGIPTSTLRDHSAAVMAVAFSPDGQRLASGGADGKIMFCDPWTHALLQTWDGACGIVWALVFSPDAQSIAAAVGSFAVYELEIPFTTVLYHTSSGKMSRVALVKFNCICAIAFTAEGPLVASSSTSNEVNFWHGTADICMGTYPNVDAADISLDGRFKCMVTHTGEVNLRCSKSGNLITTFHTTIGAVHAVSLSADANFVAFGPSREPLRLCYAATTIYGSSHTKPWRPAHKRSVVNSFDGRWLLVHIDGEIQIYDTESANSPLHIHAGGEPTTSAFSTCNELVLSDARSYVYIRKIPLDNSDSPLKGLADWEISGLAFSRDSSLLAITVELGYKDLRGPRKYMWLGPS